MGGALGVLGILFVAAGVSVSARGVILAGVLMVIVAMGVAFLPPLADEVSDRQCRADRDGDCVWPGCPQLADGEPAATGRHCPFDEQLDDWGNPLPPPAGPGAA